MLQTSQRVGKDCQKGMVSIDEGIGEEVDGGGGHCVAIVLLKCSRTISRPANVVRFKSTEKPASQLDAVRTPSSLFLFGFPSRLAFFLPLLNRALRPILSSTFTLITSDKASVPVDIAILYGMADKFDMPLLVRALQESCW